MLNGLTICAMFLCMISFFFINRSDNAVDLATTNRYDLTANAKQFMDGSAYLTNQVRAYAATGNQVHYDNYWYEINTLKNRDIGVANLKKIGITSEEQALIDEMSALSNNLVPREEEAMKLTSEGKTAEALEAVYGQAYEDTIARIRSIQDTFLEKLDTRAAKEVRDLKSQVVFYTVLLFICLVMAILAQFVSVFYTQKKIIHPLIRIKDAMTEISRGNLSGAFELSADTSEMGNLIEAIIKTKTTLKSYIADITVKLQALADGDMTTTVEMEYIGEFEPIRSSLISIFESLNGVMGEVAQSSTQVTSASHQIAQASQNLASGSSEQSATIEELNSAASEILEQAKNTSLIASQALEDNGKAGELMGECMEDMQQMTRAMTSIQDSSQRISNVIKVIEDIAFQTNILALNAAVEAARAAQYGKGFAVVADEVRSLATKSSEAARETTSLIEASLLNVTNGCTIVNTMDASLKSVASIAKINAGQIAQMNDASGQQTNTLSHLSNGISQLSTVVQANAATAEETAAASQQMSSQADVLTNVISRFRLSDQYKYRSAE